MIGVIGPGGTDAGQPAVLEQAEDVGTEVARRGALVVCGGLGGAMEAACRGARAAGGLTIGILPGLERGEANPYVDLVLATGLGEQRNWLVVRTSDALVAVGGGHGTLSEIALALKAGRPVVGLATWQVSRPDGGQEPGLIRANSARDAVALAISAAGSAIDRRS
jgi:uncharacterized protein (TIGR00725 family)